MYYDLSQESVAIDSWGPAVLPDSQFLDWKDLDKDHHIPEHVLENKDDYKIFLHKGHPHFVPDYSEEINNFHFAADYSEEINNFDEDYT